jgi:hypothetical protein
MLPSTQIAGTATADSSRPMTTAKAETKERKGFLAGWGFWRVVVTLPS